LSSISDNEFDLWDGLLEDWPQPRGQNFVALALVLASTMRGLGVDFEIWP